MKIIAFDIQNFRKLKSCRIKLGDDETIFVGANNSGKTSAMDALILFLDKSKHNKIRTTDFTLSNWIDINAIATNWDNSIEDNSFELYLEQLRPHLPVIDVWIDVNKDHIHYVNHLIPTLDWKGGKIGVRLSFEPLNIETLCTDYFKASSDALEIITSGNRKYSASLWPTTFKDFLDRKLGSYFGIKAFLLNPADYKNLENEHNKPQPLPPDSYALDVDPFNGLIKINVVNAQRGFSDERTEGGSEKRGKLSAQLGEYYEHHINPYNSPTENDLLAIQAIENTRSSFNEQLKVDFKEAIKELEGLGYPGFSDPSLSLTSNINPINLIKRDTTVQFLVGKDSDSIDDILYLPERHNGLGYQNLISIIFSLIQFRDAWMRKGKTSQVEEKKSFIEPLHLVLIEEPEAHLHPQAQQVFIKQAFKVLRNHPNLGDSFTYKTQLIVSTHSSHISHEADFSCLRYFQKIPSTSRNVVPSANVINLENAFGEELNTLKFAKRYLKTTHCDLFFADAVILVEGAAERMLIPHFLKNEGLKKLDSRYISILEIGGSHAHRLKPLIEALGIFTLIITDIDPIDEKENKKVLPITDQNYRTRNHTLKTWLPSIESLDELYECEDMRKISSNGRIRVCYQTSIRINDSDAFPYTFEDSLVLENRNFISTLGISTDKSEKKDKVPLGGLLGKMQDAVSESNVTNMCQQMFDALSNGKKAEMALALLFYTDPIELKVPQYIGEGLEWLESNIAKIDHDLTTVG